MRRALLLLMLGLTVLVLFPGMSAAQFDDACPTIVMTAIEVIDDYCYPTGRNQACYGHALVEARGQDGTLDFSFQQEGDIRDVLDLQEIHTAPLEEETSLWGIALMRIQADLPDTLPGQNVTMVLFGDATLAQASSATAPETVSVTANATVNLREGPSTGYAVAGTLAAGEVALANGRLADGSWLRLRRAEQGDTVWVSAPLVTPDGDVDALGVVEAGQPAYGPMQAFTFNTGWGDAPCTEAPESGILFQTPAGAGEVTLNFNGVDIALGSTALLQGGAQMGRIELSLLEGAGTLPGPDGEILGGQSWNLQLQEGAWTPAGDPQPLDSGRFLRLPLQLLPDRIHIFERQVIQSGPYEVVTRYFPPLPDAPPLRSSAILLHGRDLDWTSWQWLVPSLLERGWGVLVPDMPGHGETGGQPNYGDWASVVESLAEYARTRGFERGTILGSSIGANSGLVACAGLTDWCVGAAMFSPGTDYFGVRTLPAMQRMGERPILILTSENDSRGGPGRVAREIAEAGRNVTTQIFEGSLHGTFLADAYDLVGPVDAWLSGLAGE